MQAIILAGGLGTRLRAVVGGVPKPMAPIAGRPFIFFLLDLLGAGGITDVTLSVGYLRESIIGAVGDCYGTVRVRYAIEDEPLGTGGGLRTALAQVGRFPVFALNGDTLLDLDYRSMLALHEKASANLSIAVRRVPDAGRYGRALVEAGRIVGFAADGAPGEGMINAGVYLFGSNLLDDPALPRAFSWERDYLAPRLAELRPLAVPADGYFIDIGVPADYQRAQIELPGR